VLQTCLSI